MKHFLYIILLFVFCAVQSVRLQAQIDQVIGITDDKFSVMRDHFYKQNPKYSEQSYGSQSEYLRIEHTDKNFTHFKRWEQFWSNRLMPDGTFPSTMMITNAINQKLEQRAIKKNESKFGADPQWTLIGPVQIPKNGGNGRINCITMHPNLTNLIWAGSAAGGAWKSTDFGQTWTTTCDDLFSMGVSDIAMPWNNPNIVYLATGDDDAGCTYTIGVMKSTDGGISWNQTGLSYQTSSRQQIHRLLSHPTIAGKLYAATSQGLFVTSDAGATWQKKSTINFRDLEIRPGSEVMIGCEGRDIHRSTDGGNTWAKITTSIPNSVGRISLAISPANPDYMYALCADNAKGWGFGGLYRSVDGGKTWVSRSTTPNILSHSVDGSQAGGQGWYDLTIACSYKQPNHIIIGGVNIWRSTDGGANWTISAHWYGDRGTPYVHADIHDLEYLPNSDKVIISGSDGGVSASSDNGLNWVDNSDGLAITQYYHVATAQSLSPSYVGGAQDNGTTRYASNAWSQILGGDGMKCLIHPTNAQIVFGAIQNGYINRSIDAGKSFEASLNPDIAKESGRWVTPYVFDPVTPSTMYAGFRNIWKSTNTGQSGTWKKISDFSNTASTIKIISVSPANPNTIIAMNDQVVYESIDGGETWSSKTMPAPLTANAITSWAFSHDNENTAWVTIGDFGNTRVYKTINGGKNWTDISGNLPKIPTNVIIHEKGSPERIYVGTDIGVYYSDSTTNGWIEYSAGLPNTIVRELQINYPAKTLIAGTYGRGLWKGNLVGCTGFTATISAVGQLSFCAGDSVELKVNEEYAAYRWSNGSTTKSIFVKQSGSYTATVTDENGCTSTTSPITVVANTKPTPRISTTKGSLCDNDTVVLDAGVFSEYKWSNGDTSRRIVVSQPGDYTVTVVGNNGCVATSTVYSVKKAEIPQKPNVIRSNDTLQSSIIGSFYEWYENDVKITGAIQRRYVPKPTSIGNRFKVKISNSSQCSNISDDFLYSPLSLQEEISSVLKIYPNPAQQVLYFEFPSVSFLASISIIDVQGKTVLTSRIDCPKGLVFDKIRIADILPGRYTLRIEQDNYSYNISFVKQ